MDNDMLSSLFNDPEKLQSAMKMASDMLGGGTMPSAGSSAPPGMGAPSPSRDYDPSQELMERALPVISSIVQSGQTAVGPEKRALLNAVKPFVTDQVAGHFDHAMRLVSMARMARAALGQVGQKKDAPPDGTQSL
ncbi:hypothetical protein [Agathobaculum sp.]|uniref:hypothetical protein n=1 Tax=Agathobaculum sp. TaxID=2048138 RepID=UPI002A81F8E4|nr:hypothetical protein [Agathobaculum sp.]MDY3617910.1 hypothetical protein [Agathobaculum sp.]